MKNKPTLVFVTTLSLANNPRLVKEFETLQYSYTCIVISFQHHDWSTALTQTIIQRNPEVKFIQIDRKTQVFTTLISKLMHKLCIAINPLVKENLSVVAYAHHDKTYQLLYHIKKVFKNTAATRIIAHNLGAFYPAFKLAKQKNIPLQFDVEDYHPGEIPYFNSHNETHNRKVLMKKALYASHHVTYASPLIQQECLNLVQHHPKVIQKSTVINNCFSKEEFEYKNHVTDKVKFVWFSQNISKGRGLEQLLPVLDTYADQIELHLIGNLYPDFDQKYIQTYSSFIEVHQPLPQKELNLKLAEFDIGLALEVKSNDFNRQICLTNKIWAYLQSGLFIFASDTLAQKQFLDMHAHSGLLISEDTKAMHTDIKRLITDIQDIRQQKLNRFTYAQNYAWEIEQDKLKQILAQ